MILITLLALGMFLPGLARAQTVDRISFAQTGIVHVWSEGETPQMGQQVRLQPSAANSVLPMALYAGVLEPVSSALPPHIVAKASHRFSIASNTGFSIRAELAPDSGNVEGDLSIRLVRVGQNASASQNMDGAAVLPLQALLGGRSVYSSPARTARAPGSVESQALSFQAVLPEGSDAEVILTIVAEPETAPIGGL